ncbi:hypothetical protein TWF225_001625 [Orbilia oligospora]|uniref:Uncharacterized protein n=1 Tax=Orbilia oligospora TaxID=2813651 RepID=A0A7C8K2W2_ORBOL|nr:hypothetical protein TWF751_005038 [Orbilia oligospora]KAF3164639.1 hypothetical protein TWF225_001625 [Orbilia oligospora]KAF3292028.1 hypothetical protein TWF132_006272 [Orbilia oligospora]TGJ74746.1 hypothetical protein EYR41_001712 [Orbilia oligospora]
MQFQSLVPTQSEPIHTPHSALSHHATMVRRESTFLALTEEPAVAPWFLRQRRPSNFLVLAPVTSESYPSAPRPQRATIMTYSKDNEEAIASSPELGPSAAILPVEPMVLKTRRSTSVSSTSSEGRRLRFLKLNPVHWGGEEGEDDYAIEE